MSGICGIVNVNGEPVDHALLQRLTAFVAFRGPDAQDTWIDEAVGFGHALLRTTFEAELEHQPLSLDGTVWITADARIDGQVELKKKLTALGRPNLDTANDPELILHAYHAWGEDCVSHLIGDFAFAIWDAPRKRLFCARDHFGVKPFFYANVGQTLIFSNTLNCLRQHPAISAELDDLWIADFLLFEMTLDPAATAFADIRRLPPAHCLSWSADGLQSRRYWELPAALPVRYRPTNDYVEHFNELLADAVTDRLRSDRVGVDMSGGLDSSSIATVASTRLPVRSRPAELRAYTIVYDQFFPDQERQFATLVAEKLGIPIRYCVGDTFGLFEHDDRGQAQSPEPFHCPNAAIDRDSMRAAAMHGRVVLTGWDGDALLNESPKPYFRSLFKQGKFALLLMGMAGYAVSQRRLVPLGFRDWWKRRRGKSAAPALSFPKWISPELEQRFNLRARWNRFNEAPAKKHPIRPAAFRDLSFLRDLSSFFDFYDAGVTGLQLEYRHPLLDLRLVEYCLSLPPWPWCIRKHILRTAMLGRLPEPVRRRRKAPLVGYPLQVLLRRTDTRWVDQFVAFPDLNRYVVRKEIPPVCGEEEPNAAWDNLRPLSLDLWLQGFQQTINRPETGVP
jgi:asparagine synthase (glutamine-hydrolysing)